MPSLQQEAPHSIDCGPLNIAFTTIVVTCSCFENNDAVIYMTIECRSPVMRHVFGLQQISPVISTRMNRFRIFSPWVHLFPLLNGMTRCNLFNPLPHHLRRHLSAAILCLAFSALPKQFSSGCFPVCRVVAAGARRSVRKARTRPRILQLSQQKNPPNGERSRRVNTLSCERHVVTARKKWRHMQQDSDLAVAVCAVLDRNIRGKTTSSSLLLIVRTESGANSLL